VGAKCDCADWVVWVVWSDIDAAPGHGERTGRP
jgi:hypothetical protein